MTLWKKEPMIYFMQKAVDNTMVVYTLITNFCYWQFTKDDKKIILTDQTVFGRQTEMFIYRLGLVTLLISVLAVTLTVLVTYPEIN